MLQKTPHEESEIYRRMGRAIGYLSENYRRQPGLDEAARAAGLSPAHFQRQFARYIGVSPKHFVAYLTLEHAKQAITRRKNVLEAAWAAGLSGPSRLHDLCLKIEAMTPGEYAKGGAGLDLAYAFHPTVFGTALLVASPRGLSGLGFGAEGEEEAMLADMRKRWPKARFLRDDAALAPYVHTIFSARRGELPIQLFGTPWQIKVWQALLAIPEGRIASYADIAKTVCSEKASRAVGAAVGRNPISLLIPCHRVLATSGALTGYHWGVDRKRAMLALEYAAAHPEP